MRKFLSRVLVVTLAYYFAVLCAFAIIAISLVINVALAEPGRGIGYALSVSFLLMLLGAGIPPLITLIVPAIAIITAEYISMRSWIYYTGVGALTGIMVLYSTRPESSSDAQAGGLDVFAALSLLAGIIGGLVYWRTTGRNAGLDAEKMGNRKK